jgi:hypothetical protein
MAMANWKERLYGNPIPWLMEPDETQPAIRYYALRDLLDRDENDSEVKAAKTAIMTSGPVPVILAAQHPAGYWGKPGPRYTETMPALVYLAQFGADGTDRRIRAGCEILLSRYVNSEGVPYDDTYCTAAVMGATLIDFGWLNDQRLQTSMEWLARTITGEGEADPPFACPQRNANLPCAWGAIKAMAALNKVPREQKTRNMQEAITRGVDFLLSHDPAVADYPYGRGRKPSSTWFKFYYPLGSEADMLQNLEVLVALGQAQNPRLSMHWIWSSGSKTNRDAGCLNGPTKSWQTLRGKKSIIGTTTPCDFTSPPASWPIYRNRKGNPASGSP